MKNKSSIIFDFNRTLYDPVSEKLEPGALEIFEILQKKNCEMFLLSHAEKNREDLIENLGIQGFFKEIIIKERKAQEDFEILIKKYNILPQESFVIGDRVKAEILFGNRLGFQTIWLKRGKFMNEVPEIQEEQPTFIVNTLVEALNILETHCTWFYTSSG